MADGPQMLEIEHIESPQFRNVYVRRDEVCIWLPETQLRALILSIGKSLMADEA